MKYYYSINDKQEGPVTFDELIKINITKQTLILYDGLSDWDVAENIEELKDFFKPKNTPPTLPTQIIFKPPSLPKQPIKAFANFNTEHSLVLEKFKNEFLKNNIYHSEQQFSNNINTQIAYIRKTKLKWLATQLNTFIVVGSTESLITKQLIHNFTEEAFIFSKRNNKGLPRGLHSSIGVIAVLIGKSADFQAKHYCLKLSKHFSAFKIPVIVDMESNEIIHFEGTPIWGMMYYPYLKRLISENIKGIINNTKQ